MPDEVTVKSKSDSPSESPATGSENQSVSMTRAQLTSLCAAGLGVSFFLPWAKLFFGAQLSGFDLQKSGNEQYLLWLIPIFCTITIIAGLTKSGQAIASRLTGALPFFVGVYWYYKLGSDIFHILTYGAFFSLIFGAALLILPPKLK